MTACYGATYGAPIGGTSSRSWYWRFLGLEPDATDEEIRAAYVALAKRLHPDHGGTVEDMVRLNMAYECAKRRRD